MEGNLLNSCFVSSLYSTTHVTLWFAVRWKPGVFVCTYSSEEKTSCPVCGRLANNCDDVTLVCYVALMLSWASKLCSPSFSADIDPSFVCGQFVRVNRARSSLNVGIGDESGVKETEL